MKGLSHPAPLLLIVSFLLFALPTLAQSPSLIAEPQPSPISLTHNPPSEVQIAQAFRGTGCSTGLTACRAAVEQVSLNTLPGISAKSSGQVNAQSFGFWEVGGGFTSTLILRNKDSQNSVVANITLFSPDGNAQQESQIEVAARSVGRVLLSDLVKLDTRSVHSGGLMLEFLDGSAANAIGTVILENYGKGLIFDLPLTGGNRYDTGNALHAPWWLIDEGTDGTVTLFNQSSQSIVVSPSIIAEGTERITPSLQVAAHGTKTLSIRELLRQQGIGSSTGSIGLSYTGPAHALAPVLLLANPATGFSLASPFNARHGEVELGGVAWRFPDVFLSSDPHLGFNKDQQLTAYALISNPTKSRISPQLIAYVNDEHGQQQIALPAVPLQPLETRLINLSQFVASGLLPRSAPYISLVVSHKGTPGDLGLTVFSVGQTKDFVWRSKGFTRSGQIIDSVYWDISGDLNAVLIVQNASVGPVQSKATLYYQTSHGAASYTLPPISVPGNGSRILNLKQIVLAGVPDSAGNRIPPNTTFGTLTLEVSDKASQGLLWGGSASFDPVKGKYGDPGSPPNCDSCNSTCLICIQPTIGGGDCSVDCSQAGCCPPPPPPPLSGYINPKYLVVGVIYAPPGSASNVTYSNSNTVSNTTTLTGTFGASTTNTIKITTPGGLFGFLGGTQTQTQSTTVTQQSQDSTSVTSSVTNIQALEVFGPGQTPPSNNCGPLAGDLIGVDHDCDFIKIWVNPVMLFTVTGSTVEWDGYGFSSLDPTAPIHIVDILVGCLNGDLAASDSRCAAPLGELQRPWAANENWPAGQGPALTQTDLNNILAADPWGQCTPTLPQGSSACPTFSVVGGAFVLLPPQFSLSDTQNVSYHQGSPSTSISISTTNSNMQSQKSTTGFSQTFGVEDAFVGSGFLQGFGANVSTMQTLVLNFEVNNQTTTSKTVTAQANIFPAACTGTPCNPPYPPNPPFFGTGTEFDVFIDHFFGTFVFVPSNYQ